VSEAYVGRQIVGMDVHRRRSVLVRMTESGERLETVRISNDPDYLRAVMARAGEAPEVVLEACYGWYWAADTLAELGASVHLAHPLGVKGFAYRRVKNDERDAADLADLLRMGRLPEAWIAPPEIRELRELVRHRAKLVGLRTSPKCQVHAVLAGAGLPVPMSDLFGAGGSQLLERAPLSSACRARVDSARRLIEALDGEVTAFTKQADARWPGGVVRRAVRCSAGGRGRLAPGPARRLAAPDPRGSCRSVGDRPACAARPRESGRGRGPRRLRAQRPGWAARPGAGCSSSSRAPGEVPTPERPSAVCSPTCPPGSCPCRARRAPATRCGSGSRRWCSPQPGGWSAGDLASLG